MISFDDIGAAAGRVSGRVLRTPAIAAPGLSAEFGRKTVLKLENLQIGGSFKRRGVLNRLLCLTNEEKKRELIAVSGGNFGIAMAEACQALGMALTIILPMSAPKTSAQRIAASGATVKWEKDVTAAFARADELAARGYLLIDDCDDTLIAAGSGTIALELLETHPEITDIVAAVGGGSMISGVATASRAMAPDVRIWGVESSGAEAMTKAIEMGHPVAIDVTSAISTLGVPTVSSEFLQCVKNLVEEMVVVEDRQAYEGVVDFAEKAHVWVEPAAGALIPATHRIASQLPEDAVVGLVVCGGNAAVADVIGFLYA
ncbi:MAG: pyridoxal-phosphate dependent enzyme [Pseudomonadota bacterium]